MTRTRLSNVLLIVILALAGTAFAQVDPEARALLEGLGQQGDFEEFDTIDQTMVMTMHDMGQAGETVETRTRTVIDYEGQRAAIVADVMGMSTTMRYVDGEMSMAMNGMSLPMPPGMDATFDGIFDNTAYTGMLDDPNVTATYDGQVSYGDVLSGQQVTYTGDFGVPGMEMDSTTVRFVFDDSGKLIGQVMESQGMDLVAVFVGDPIVEGAMFHNMEMYELEGDSTSLFATMTYENITINEPIDETLFE